MTIIPIALLLIAVVNIALMIVIGVMVLRMNRLLDTTEDAVRRHGVPLVEKLAQVAEDVRNISGDVRRVEQRVADVASRVVDQVEPPIRHFAAVLAGVRAGVGRIFDSGHHHDGNALAGRPMRKE